jgi:hypothetical protein
MRVGRRIVGHDESVTVLPEPGGSFVYDFAGLPGYLS